MEYLWGTSGGLFEKVIIFECELNENFKTCCREIKKSCAKLRWPKSEQNETHHSYKGPKLDVCAKNQPCGIILAKKVVFLAFSNLTVKVIKRHSTIGDSVGVKGREVVRTDIKNLLMLRNNLG